VKMNMAATGIETSIAIFDFINFNCRKVTTWLTRQPHSNQIMFSLIAECLRLHCYHLNMVLSRFYNFHTFNKTNFL
jgi:hypothetical protein